MLEYVTGAYISGEFFLTNLSLFFEVTPELALTIYHLRQEWITQYELNTVPELLLLDQAMLAYFHTIRLNNEFDGFVAEDAVKQLQERLMPLMERFNLMFLRNLRAMRELKTNPVNINIGRAGQVNVGQQQVNVSKV